MLQSHHPVFASPALAQYKEWAKYGVDKVTKKFPLGGLNKVSCREQLGEAVFNQERLNLHDFEQAIKKLHGTLAAKGVSANDIAALFCVEDHNNFLDNFIPLCINSGMAIDNAIMKEAFACQEALNDKKPNGLYCGGYAMFTFLEIIHKYPEAMNSIEFLHFDNHVVLLIGRNTTDESISAWSKEAIIIDAWDNKIYTRDELRAIAKQEESTPFYKGIANYDCFTEVIPNAFNEGYFIDTYESMFAEQENADIGQSVSPS